MSPDQIWLLAFLIFLAAAIYSAVGHAGASGYIAVMALVGIAPAEMKPTALVLNILVASLATARLWRADLIAWRALLPLTVASVPLAFVGGAVQLPGHWYRILVGLMLLVAAWRLFFDPRDPSTRARKTASIPLVPALLSGAMVGLLSGLTGTGGGIFLSPLLLFFGWAGVRQSAGITAPFILVNSIAGLAGNLAMVGALPPELPYLAGAALLGAILGTQFAIHWLAPKALQKVLAVVLVIAGVKFLTV